MSHGVLHVLSFLLLVSSVSAAHSAAADPPYARSPVVDEVFYHFMPIAWRDSDNDGGKDGKRFGDFNGMTASLDYLKSLGITSVWINPIYPSPAYHGYHHGPADKVNPWFGKEADFLRFVREAKRKGIKVYLDLVCYGISQDSVYFLSAHNNPKSRYSKWLAFRDPQNTTFWGYDFTTWDGGTVTFIDWDLRNAGARREVIRMSKKWLDPHGDGSLRDGIAGFRLDHVYAKGEHGPGGLGYTLDTFWKPWRDAMRAVNPKVFTFTEQAEWSNFGTDLLSVHDGAFTKPFEFAAREALRQENARLIYEFMDRSLGAVQSAGRGTLLCILGDHDVNRLASDIGADKPETAGRAKAAAAILMLQPFPPIVYFGDEIGMRGRKGNFGPTDAVDIPMREPFKWKAVNDGPPMTNYYVLNKPAYEVRNSRDHDGISVEEQQGVPGSLLETYRGLIALRHKHPALRRGTYTPVKAADPRVWAFTRTYAPVKGTGQTLLVAVNLGGAAFSPALDLSGFSLPATSAPVKDAVTGETLPAITDENKGAYTFPVAPYGFRILSLPSSLLKSARR